MSAVGDGVALSAGERLLWPPQLGPPNSQSPLEMTTSLWGASLGSRGLMRSSTVTAAMALMLVDAVLGDTDRRSGVISTHPGTSHTPSGPTC